MRISIGQIRCSTIIGLLLLLILSQSVQSQRDRNIWYFSDSLGIDFSSGTAVATRGPINTQEGCDIATDTAGNLLFSTDGVDIYNRLGVRMPGYTILWGGISTTQSAQIVPQPGNDSIYFIFTAATQVGCCTPPFYSGIAVTTVNMRLDAGLGQVIRENDTLLPYTCEKLCAIRNSNGRDYWVVAHKFGSYDFYVYPVTDTGIGAPIIQPIGRFYFPGLLMFTGGASIGYLRASPDGMHLASASWYHRNDSIDLFDFNPCTGIISNYQPVLYPSTGYGLCFSGNSKFLYLTPAAVDIDSACLYQFDISASDISSTRTDLRINVPPGIQMGALQRGPDDKIYVICSPDSTIGVINNPNIGGVGCNYDMHALSFDGSVYFSMGVGLPNFIDGTFLPPNPFAAIPDTSVCLGTSVGYHFSEPSYIEITWNGMVHGRDFVATDTGMHYVSAVSGCNTYFDTFYVHSKLASIPTIKDTTTCYGVPLTINLTDTIFGNILWNGIDSGAVYVATDTGLNYVTANTACGLWRDTFYIHGISSPAAFHFNDTSACPGQAVGFNFTIPGYNLITWNVIDTGTSYTSSDSGSIIVNAYHTCGMVSDTFVIHAIHILPFQAFRDTSVCNGVTLTYTITDTAYHHFLWNGTDSSNLFNTSDTGIAIVNARNYCATVNDTFFIHHIKNSVTIPLPDTLVCAGINVIYSFTDTAFHHVVWNGTDTGNIFLVHDSGMQTLSAQSICGEYRDTFFIRYLASLHSPNFNDTAACIGVPISMIINDRLREHIFWSNGDTGILFTTTDSGRFYVLLSNACGVVQDSFMVTRIDCSADAFMMAIPDAFTPNGDGVNDFFNVFARNVEAYQVYIFNRWGEQVYEASDVNALNNLSAGWDGRFLGNPQPIGTYIYSIKVKDNKNEWHLRQGVLTLIR